MPSLLVKDFVKDFDLGKVFAVRLRRLTKIGRTQHSSTTAHHNSISADIPSDFPVPSPNPHSNPSPLLYPGYLASDLGLEVSINIFSTRSSHGDSSVRTASDIAQTFLPVVQSVAGAIPVAGPPIQAAISGLLSILQVIDRYSQNKADLVRLTTRLHRLSSHMCNAPPAQDPLEQDRSDSIIGILQETSAQLTRLQNVVSNTHPSHKLSPGVPLKSTVICWSLCGRSKCSKVEPRRDQQRHS
ncbi:uncharacterized protein EDB93DRAFT_544416 [Suillus bovinus]|uniref:uncharacterized protein n=1 Tax=Suillus bovinus TaxID=48563 RepID=UPI001B876A92|nr:uncharacterized protein EDB93DRAFT_544416 [Suillus bovinus]KAG2144113.1 hypothetical protein EDB93DRAFT_544416 [Suillus bovinus]